MTGPIDLVLFGHLVRKPEAELDLERAALLIAESEYPGLDVAAYVAKLDQLAATVRLRMRAEGLVVEPAGSAARYQSVVGFVLGCIYGELGFRGNVCDYYDPRNSFFNEVLDRRTGIPITLALVLMGVCWRVGIAAFGVSFPGHFLVRMPRSGGEPLFVDPFDGRILSSTDLKALYEQATGDPGDVDTQVLQPAGRRQILARMLNNLRAIYEVRGDRRRLQRVLERMAIVTPSDEVRSRLDLLVQNVPLAPRVSVN
jgi:regulator of sirC expression with transglutaminase-like and TPR domain